MTVTFNNKFNRGDNVFYITPDSDKGVVLDIEYSVKENDFFYIVSFGRKHDDQIRCSEIELSLSKVF